MRTRGRRRAFPRPAHVTSGARGRAGRAGSAGRLCARCRTRLPLPLDPRSAPYSRAGECPRGRPCVRGGRGEGPPRGRDHRKLEDSRRETPGNGDAGEGVTAGSGGPQKVVGGTRGLGAPGGRLPGLGEAGRGGGRCPRRDGLQAGEAPGFTVTNGVCTVPTPPIT